MFNERGDQVLEEKSDGAGKTQTIKYGLIRLIKEKEERRVSFKTLLAIMEAEKNKVGAVMIQELNMAVKLTQIVMMRSETENVRIEDNFTKLPTEVVILNDSFNITNKSRTQLNREQESYYIATCHYMIDDGVKQYLLDVDKIKNLVKVEFDDDGNDIITERYVYSDIRV